MKLKLFYLFLFYLIQSGLFSIPVTDSLQAAKKWKNWFANFDLKPKEVVVSLGCGNAWREFELSLLCDSVHFYLEDLDSVSLNKKNLDISLSDFKKNRRKPLTHTYDMVYGTTTSVPLKDGIADKVIIMNAYHHFDDKAQMLKEINRLLKPDGKLIITDHLSPNVSKKSGYGCDREYWLLNEKDFMDLLNTAGFVLDSKTKMDGKTFQFVCKKK
jgi:SAM-dependent methyltransferase